MNKEKVKEFLTISSIIGGILLYFFYLKYAYYNDKDIYWGLCVVGIVTAASYSIRIEIDHKIEEKIEELKKSKD